MNESELLEKCHEYLTEYKCILEQEGDSESAEQVYDLIDSIETHLEI